ncbi:MULTISPECIES: Glu/Leu/Phe/Val family dehydrogenase [Pseudovibrio]|uniref:Glu/Leu/Phe/Val family dehydrogenase n=1 Tax=Stappiaceae TaxID=2821832 RepID=UPI002366D772|nr:MULTISPECIES: Glu/Leu/Phe/Val dehydrogenase [Pseudovibrio]MDD7911814.1 Glu/Leu/Phe/Val dehydrogenase [Pseudovibrio exalbescens]MDX5594737.1 Glu/Leu/Phe/Val dehydrogenase [Pseudovibrio sp. SPO723]
MNAPLAQSVTLDESSTTFDHPEFSGHEQVVFAHDAASGLRAIIAVHDTRLGPALGGCRMWGYHSNREALTDALRLSKGMTYKNALAGLPLGGGKSVIIADPKTQKTPELLSAFGKHVDRLAGGYITAEDVGITASDMEIIAAETDHARGTKARGLGDPSPYTALGVFVGLQAAVRHQLKTDSLKGLRVSVQGLGNVGYGLCRHLHAHGAQLIVSDIHKPNVERAVAEFGATPIDPRHAHSADADVYAPCALGATLNVLTIPELKATVIAGAANNQLKTPTDGIALMDRGVLYAPDYVINAGGVISVAIAKAGDDDTEVRAKTLAIGDTLTAIFNRADEEQRPTSVVADEIALERLNAAG